MIVKTSLAGLRQTLICAAACVALAACSDTGTLTDDGIIGDDGVSATDDAEAPVPAPANEVEAPASEEDITFLASSEFSDRIVNGTTVPDLRYPWMAAVYFRVAGTGQFFQGCGGSVIADRWILSAAHCFRNGGQTRNPNDVALLLGTPNLNSADRTVRFVDSVTVHPQYNANTNQNDIALLELSEPVSFQPIALSDNNNPVPSNGETATVAGWGATTETGGGTSLLQETNLPIVSTGNCQALYGNLIDGQTMVCAGGQETDACFGDSGGPLMVPRGDQLVQAGVVSFGFGCARPGLPAVYARVSTQFDWINSVVGSLQPFGSSDAEIAEIDEIEAIGEVSSVLVGLRKRNAPNFAVSSSQGGANGQNVFLNAFNPNDINQQWVEMTMGDGSFMYRKNGTSFCFDGGDGGDNRQNVFLSICSVGNLNQSWIKQAVGDGGFRLVKRSATGFVLDGGSNGSIGQNVQIFDANNPSQNLQWFITSL